MSDEKPIDDTGFAGPFEDVAIVAFVIHCLRGFPPDDAPWQPKDYLRFFATGVGFLTMYPDDPDVRGEVRGLAERFAAVLGVTPLDAVGMLPEPSDERAGMLRRVDEVLALVTSDVDAPAMVVSA